VISDNYHVVQGRVFTPHIVDAMTIQMLFNPNILEFWQVMMGMKRESSIALEARGVRKEEDEARESFRKLVWRNAQRHHPSKVTGRPTQGMFDKLSIPLGFEGKTFRELFNYLLNRYGTIAIGLYRLRALLLSILFLTFPSVHQKPHRLTAVKLCRHSPSPVICHLIC
jgi:hypothetical protein